jgi:hypothetical protein
MNNGICSSMHPGHAPRRALVSNLWCSSYRVFACSLVDGAAVLIAIVLFFVLAMS